MYTKKCAKFCEVCAHFSLASWYYINRKNPPIHYIVLLHPIRNEIPSPEKPGYPARLFAYLDMWKKMENKEKKVNNRYTGVLHI